MLSHQYQPHIFLNVEKVSTLFVSQTQNTNHAVVFCAFSSHLIFYLHNAPMLKLHSTCFCPMQFIRFTESCIISCNAHKPPGDHDNAPDGRCRWVEKLPMWCRYIIICCDHEWPSEFPPRGVRLVRLHLAALVQRRQVGSAGRFVNKPCFNL